MPRKGILNMFAPDINGSLLSWIDSHENGGEHCPALIGLNTPGVAIVAKHWSLSTGERWLLPAAVIHAARRTSSHRI